MAILCLAAVEMAFPALMSAETAARTLQSASESTFSNYESIRSWSSTYRYEDKQVLRDEDARSFAEKHALDLPQSFLLIEVIEQGLVRCLLNRADNSLFVEIVPEFRQALIRKTVTDTYSKKLGVTFSRKLYRHRSTSIYASFDAADKANSSPVRCWVTFTENGAADERDTVDPRLPFDWPEPAWELLDRAARVLANASREDKASGGIKLYPITSEGRTLYRLVMPAGLDQAHGCSLDINLDPSAGMNVSSAGLVDADGKRLKQLQTVYEKHEGVYLPGSFRYIEITDGQLIAFERCLELVESSVNSPHFKGPRLDMLGLPEGQLISADGDTPTYILKSGDLVPLPESEHFSALQAHSAEKTSGKSVYFYATLATAGIATVLVWYLLRGPLHS